MHLHPQLELVKLTSSTAMSPMWVAPLIPSKYIWYGPFTVANGSLPENHWLPWLPDNVHRSLGAAILVFKYTFNVPNKRKI